MADTLVEREFDKIVANYKRNTFETLSLINKNIGDDITVVGVGLYTPYQNENVNLTIEDYTITYNVGALIDEAVVEMNDFLASAMAAYKGGYADTYTGVDLISIRNPFPTDEGNLEIARRILGSQGDCIVAESGKGGTITPAGTRFVTNIVGEEYVVEADSGYLIRSLRVDGEKIAAASGKESYTYTFTDAAEKNTTHTVVAVFENPENTYDFVTTIGDSVAAGFSLPGYTGDFSNPATCYNAVVARHYNATNNPNLALPAMTTDDFLAKMEDPLYRNAVEDSDLVILELGVNDLNMALLKAALE
ncbi:MAG: SGNH/GDSL hydrolase family protein, partial [Clostridia bacterium]|nr:SGNH/GDSL hydrolase family protein [Clostridia bacterium]